MIKDFLYTSLIVAVVIAVGFFVSFNTDKPFSYGLDLQGGARLVYVADTSEVEIGEIQDKVGVLQKVIERRVNAFGVSEPLVYIESTSSLLGKKQWRLVVELPGVTDVKQAVEEIGKTPLLEFKILQENGDDYEFVDTEIKSDMVKSASLQFNSGHSGALTGEPVVLINFNSEGGKLFGDLTKENLGGVLGIFLDGVPISQPVIRAVITGGSTIIQGSFTIEDAQELATNINLGALPLPIELAETQTIDASLGAETLEKSTYAGGIAFALVILFLIFAYRLFGLIAGVSLLVYLILLFAIFKSIPIVLTAAGLAGFVMSIGFAVDANILIYERVREEFINGKSPKDAVEIGFKRAWSSIRDANISSLIIAIILFWMGTSLVKGFALTFGIGIIMSMLVVYFFLRQFIGLVIGRSKKYNKLFIGK